TSNVTALPEVAGNGALLIDPFSFESLAEGLNHMLCDSALRARLVSRGLERARSFNWDRTAATTWRVLAETAAESTTRGRAFPTLARGQRRDAANEQSARSKGGPSHKTRLKVLHIIGMAHGGAGQHVLSLSTGCDSRCFQSTV